MLEADFSEVVAAEPELLAWHLTEAGLFKKAVHYWLRAGESATERSANREAIAHLKRGIEVLGRLPESQERDEQELLLHVALMGPFMANKGYASAELEQTAKRAVALGYLGSVVIVLRQVPEAHHLDTERDGKPSELFQMQTILIIQPAEKVDVRRAVERGSPMSLAACVKLRRSTTRVNSRIASNRSMKSIHGLLFVQIEQ